MTVADFSFPAASFAVSTYSCSHAAFDRESVYVVPDMEAKTSEASDPFFRLSAVTAISSPTVNSIDAGTALTLNWLAIGV